MLVVARAHSKQELGKKLKEGRKGREAGGSADQKGPELCVEVMGRTLPTISYEDELKVYSVPQYNLGSVHTRKLLYLLSVFSPAYVRHVGFASHQY